MKGHKHHGGRHHGGGKHHHHGAQTFRRGRALEFLERLKVKRDTLKRQLEAAELQEIKPIVQGELKALELVIEEYTRHFEIHEFTEPYPEPEREEERS
ncbi:hypothetical protein [Paenibacillus silvisoli]|uniref:hypothetical protein n=1 Tax=Paenibacillus silvisoli TaxID=3110539 RepID=UPI00280570B3|nr:hypothetical protein [Paenibacillus silvisoli]